MNKEIRILIGEIITVFLLCTSVIVYFNNKIEQKLTIDNDYYAYALTNLNIEEKENYKYNFYPMTDEYAIANLKDSIFVINNYGVTTNYQLIFVVSKDSTINIENMKLRINDKIITLNNYDYEDEFNFYYNIEKGVIDKMDSIDINYRVWLDEKTDILTGNILKYYFEVI